LAFIAQPSSETVFRAAWSWVIPVAGALVVFSAILVTTPPGFAAIPQVLFFASRGPSTDAAAYALGAAAACGLVTLAVLAALCVVAERALRRGH
jgi:hypothetical protein